MSWSKLGMVLAGFVGSLLLTEGVFSATHINGHVTSSLGTVLGSLLTPIKGASEPSLLLLLGAFLIVIAIRIRGALSGRREEAE